jgi:hypothetical protein
LHVAQPVVDQTQRVAAQRRENAAAAVVAADDDVAHRQHVDRELQGGEAVQVGMDHDVGDVAVDEHLARRQADDLIRRHPAVRAADPEVARRLLARQALEEVRLAPGRLGGPGAVVGEQLVEGGHAALA